MVWYLASKHKNQIPNHDTTAYRIKFFKKILYLYEKYGSQTFQRYSIFQNPTILRWCSAFWTQPIPIFFIDFQDFSIIFLNLFKYCLNIEMYSKNRDGLRSFWLLLGSIKQVIEAYRLYYLCINSWKHSKTPQTVLILINYTFQYSINVWINSRKLSENLGNRWKNWNMLSSKGATSS